LSEKALRWLDDAVQDEGITVSAVSVPELWMAATRKRGARAVPRTEYELVRDTLLDRTFAIDIEYLSPLLWPYFEEASTRIKDPFDALIVATALELSAPLVSADDAINGADLVQVVW